MKTVMNLRVPLKAGYFLIDWLTDWLLDSQEGLCFMEFVS
jgi:hypothetical protein